MRLESRWTMVPCAEHLAPGAPYLRPNSGHPGEHDALVPQQWAEEVSRLLPHGQLTVVPRTARTMKYTSSDVFVAAIRRFLEL